MREYICTQCRQCICDLSGATGDVCSTCLTVPGWSLDPKLRDVFWHEPYAEGCLRAFAQELFKKHPHGDAIESWDLVEMAVRHGLMEWVEVSEPCAEKDCFCKMYGEGFPMKCAKRTAVLAPERPK